MSAQINKFPIKNENYWKLIKKTAQYIWGCQALIVFSGAGMGVDSGLPDFSSDQGLIQKIQSLEKKDYREIINPVYFEKYPQKFWYIYGDRYNQYKNALPHQGFYQLKEICQNVKNNSYFLKTSNVDGLWMKAGFPEHKLYERHGNIFHLQCFDCQLIFQKTDYEFDLDHEKCESLNVPKCERCSRNVRPNILMWNDNTLVADRINEQKKLYQEFIWDCFYRDYNVTILEIGAGIQYQAIRQISEQLLSKFGYQKAKFIRINPIKGYASTFGEFAVNFIDQDNYGDKIKEESKLLEIIHIKNGAKDGINDIYNELKNI